MKISEALLLVLPAVVLFGRITYTENILEGVSKGRSVARCCISIVASFFVLVYVLKLIFVWT